MKYNPDAHHRHAIRLNDYDYTEAGVYFVTVCTYDRQCLFGEVVDDKMELNELGEVVSDEWLRTGQVRPEVKLDAFVVMPNHLHGIVVINGDGATGEVGAAKPSFPGASRRLAATPTRSDGIPTSPRSGSLGSIMGQFKSLVTKRINAIRVDSGVPVWQRNYYDHIIRSEEELGRVREYILANPIRWAEDENNPARLG
ncbi:MAG: transposase [Chloroflexi bacterium]|nr:transposase [Chloroflexota bacterium]